MRALYTLLETRLASQPWKPALGAGLAIALLASLKQLGALPYLIAPLGASATLVWMVPKSPLARASAVIGGSLVSALIGFGILTTLGATPWAIGLAVGLSILAMVVFDVLHAPAGALPLVIGVNHPEPISFMVSLAISTVLLVLMGRLYGWLTTRKGPADSSAK
jgi:CBS domain-containing membrane protein